MAATTWACAPHQYDTIANVTDPAIALVSGYRGGKTWTGARWSVHRSLINPPGCRVLVMAPTWGQVKTVIVPELVAALTSAGIPYELNKSDLIFALPQERLIICRSGDRPENSKGITAACGWMDEPAVQDRVADEVFSSRVSDPRAVLRQRLYTGTHEGMHGWFYDVTRKIPTISVPMWANTALTPDTIASLKDRFRDDPARFKMYVEGQAASLSGGIYTCLHDRHRRACSTPREGAIAVGADFNVGTMCWPIARRIREELHVVGEVVTRNTTTEEHVGRVREYLLTRGLAQARAGQFGAELVDATGERVEVHMDASGAARKTSASRTDKAIVKDAGFWPRCPPANPPVKERIERVQYALSHDRLFFDDAQAPRTYDAVRHHEYEQGSSPPQPRKRWGEADFPMDAATDALGYLVCGTGSAASRSVRVG